MNYKRLKPDELISLAEGGDPKAQVELGDRYAMGERGVKMNDEEELKWITLAAEQGYPEAMYRLATHYRWDWNPRMDEAIKLYKKAAAQGEPWSQIALGECYCEGIGVRKNRPLGFKWYKKAADAGHAWAQNCVGVCYEDGIGVERDVAEAVSWYKKAAAQDFPYAHENLVRLGLERSML